MSGKSETGDSIVVPKFQRSVVWSDKQKRAFIGSVKSGFPVGCLLFFKSSVEDKRTRYTLVDGLQRASTLKDYQRSPTAYLSKDSLENCHLLDAVAASVMANVPRDTLVRAIYNYVVELHGFEEEDDYSSSDIALAVDKTLDLNLDKTGLQDMTKGLKPFAKWVKNSSDISTYEIPVFYFEGTSAQLPLVFENLNKQGTKLSKYQIYAAAWERDEWYRPITNAAIIDQIKERYDAMSENSGLVVEGYVANDEFYKSQFSMFEYVFGLGKWLAREYPDLFGADSKDAADTADSVAFALCTSCLGLSLSDMDRLPETLLKIDEGLFEKALQESTSMVHQRLKPVIAMTFNRRKSSESSRTVVFHSDYQIVSMIARVFRAKYDDAVELRSDWAETKKRLLPNLLQYYLYDIIRGFWVGSGDSKLAELVKDGSRYEIPLTRQQWQHALENWFEDQIQVRDVKRMPIPSDEELFLRFIYSKTLAWWSEASGDEFHIEHLVSVKRLMKIAGREGLPIRAVSNLCLLPKQINLDKHELTIYEYFSEQQPKSKKTQKKLQELREKVKDLAFCDEGDLEFAAKLNRDDYVLFLRKRFKKLETTFLDLYEVESEADNPD